VMRRHGKGSAEPVLDSTALTAVLLEAGREEATLEARARRARRSASTSCGADA
jgi:hypothetical protein